MEILWTDISDCCKIHNIEFDTESYPFFDDGDKKIVYMRNSVYFGVQLHFSEKKNDWIVFEEAFDNIIIERLKKVPSYRTLIDSLRKLKKLKTK